ncbi:MAG TPA: hypothetical protein VNC39_01440 [Acidocella sp.]|jgi:hypothetical protein|uniref:hypothetical protein n=1 Tax=Acidocella sp. TaxID=50710 RepID=UPI002D159CF2|nr:hypothetical protein [Acidocella sp.]HVE20613.1 hypothetical protein [Acidocella sp.]
MSETSTKLSFPCNMSGERETLVVSRIGRFGVTFAYNEDASVIVTGDDLVQIRDLLNEAIKERQSTP